MREAARGAVLRRRRRGCVRRRAGGACQLVQFGENLRGAGLVHGAAARGAVQHGFDLIAGGQGEIDQVGGGGKLSVAQTVEGRFQIVGEARDVVEAEHRARSFNGMESPEGPPDDFAVVAVLIQLEERRFQFDEQLAGLFLESLLILVNHPSTLFTTARSC